MSDLHARPSEEISPISPESPTHQSFTGAMVQSAQGQVSPTSPVRQAAITIAPPPLSSLHHRSPQQGLPPPVSIGSPGNRSSFLTGLTGLASAKSPATVAGKRDIDRQILQRQDESYLLPAKLPPKYGLFDIFPFSLLINFLTARGREVKGKKAARFRAKLKNVAVSHNLPLEISLYLVFYFIIIDVQRTLLTFFLSELIYCKITNSQNMRCSYYKCAYKQLGSTCLSTVLFFRHTPCFFKPTRG